MEKKIQRNTESIFGKTIVFVLLLMFLLMGCGDISNDDEGSPPVFMQETTSEAVHEMASSSGQSSPASNTIREPFTMIISSDPELNNWGDGCTGVISIYANASACRHNMALKANVDQYLAMANLAKSNSGWNWPNSSNLRQATRNTAVRRPYGLIINGNLTSSWKNSSDKYYEVGAYKTFYDPTYTATVPTDREAIRAFSFLTQGQLPVLYKFYPGLGRTDYFSNSNGCRVGNSGESFQYGACAVEALQYIKHKLQGNNDGGSGNIGAFGPFNGYDFPANGRGGTSSLAYYFDIGNYRFIQLHLNPKYSNSGLTVDSSLTYVPGQGGALHTTSLGSSFQWLQRVLSQTTSKKFVINMNDYGGTMAFNDPQFVAAISRKKSKIVAIFAGNVPSNQGKYEMCKTTSGRQVCTPHISGIPVFRSGSAEFGTFLLAEFGSDYMNVGTIRSRVWTQPVKVETIDGIEVGETNGLNATYVPRTPAGCNSERFGDKTYVTWNGQAIGNSHHNGPTNKINYSAVSIDSTIPSSHANVAQGINGNLFNSLVNASVKGTLDSGYVLYGGKQSPVVTHTEVAPTIEAFNGKLYIFWKDAIESEIRYQWADCSSQTATSLTWSNTHYLNLAPSTGALNQTIADEGLSSIVNRNRIHVSFLTKSPVSITYAVLGSGNNFLEGFHMTPLPRNYRPHGKQNFSKDARGNLYITGFGLYKLKNASHRINLSYGQGVSLFLGRRLHSNHKIIGSSEVIMNDGERIQVARLIAGKDIKYAISQNSSNPIDIYSTDPRNSGYITRQMTLGNSDVALAKSNDPNKLIAFWIDENNNDLYASIYLGKPDFMRNLGNSTKDQNLLKTYP